MRLAAVPLVLSLAFAPYQCAKKADPEVEREETPGEALYRLAEEFRARGDEEAYRTTLEFLVTRYPASRFAQAARTDLEALQAPDAGSP